ncbi:MAG: hypothetical protein ACRCX4_04215 [Bacteroidales bacterium]
MNKRTLYGLMMACLLYSSGTEAQNRWKTTPQGAINWTLDERVPHSDHIEMSGKRMAAVLRYGVNAQNQFILNKSLVWPMLRTIPNDTHASLMCRFQISLPELIIVNGLSLTDESVKNISLQGLMTVNSDFTIGRNGILSLKREIAPSTELPALLELYTLKNNGTNPLTIEVPVTESMIETDPAKGVKGSYCAGYIINNPGTYQLNPGDSLSLSAYTIAYEKGKKERIDDVAGEIGKRKDLVHDWTNNLVLETPDSTLNTMFAFSKIRAGESIYETKGGPMHGPGGESYYAAIWANDQAEYINPFFPFLGYEYGNQSAENSYHHFARFMNDEWKPIPSSIIAEGDDIWAGVGDRGDAAMIAYGAARYALASGNKHTAGELMPLIEWCLAYCNHKLNAEGVVASDTDELENRFPSGDANLCTSSLYYDALLSASYLSKELGKSAQAANYQKQAVNLRKAMAAYFPANVEGFDTYAYYKGNDILRSWICIPLTVGIYDKAPGTIEALFSPRLWTNDGLLTQAGSETFWDRSTLYALRGVFAAGETEKAMKFLKHYSNARLLGEHVPYAIEAWPEGSQRHLSAESALYARIITEGVFGIRPAGLKSFTLTPRMPQEWNQMALRKIRAFDAEFDIQVERKNQKQLTVSLIKDGKVFHKKNIDEGKTYLCNL